MIAITLFEVFVKDLVFVDIFGNLYLFSIKRLIFFMM